MLIAQQVDQLNWSYAACLSTALLVITLTIMTIFQLVFGVGRALRLADR
jgi:ABC-type spermidine/putrescine transport system permease subunit I